MVFPKAFQTYVPKSHCVATQSYGAILITEDGEVAVVHGKNSRKWSLPKGHGLTSETPLQAAVRELKEEAGVDMRGVKPDDEIKFRCGIYFVFNVKQPIPLNPEDSNEIDSAMWCPLNRLPYLTGNSGLNAFRHFMKIDAMIETSHPRLNPQAAVWYSDMSE